MTTKETHRDIDPDLNGWTAHVSKREFESTVWDGDGEQFVEGLTATQARVIAAAPDLLAACIEARLCINHHGIVGDIVSNMLDEAIAKSEGVTP